MKFYTFYHNDMDGRAAAWIVHKTVAFYTDDNPLNYQRHVYEDKWKLGKLDRNTTAFIVDLSFTESTYPQLIDICNRAGKVIWIDHHDSSVKLLESKPEIEKISNLAIFVNKGGSGALLTYAYTSMMYAGEVDDAYGRGNYITPTFDYEKQEVILTLQGCDKIFSVVYPEWVAYIDDYDRWAKMFEESNFFIKGCDAENTAISYKCREDKVVIYRGDDIDKTQVVKSKAGSIIFNTEFWEEIAMNTGKLIENGKIITDYCTQTYTKGLGLCFEYITEDGQRILVKNSSGNSLVFVDQIDKYDAVALFYYNGKAKVWNHSVYSYENSEFDCAAFCEKYGGGGHKHAAGFSHKTPIFL